MFTTQNFTKVKIHYHMNNTSSVGWGCKIHELQLCKWVNPPPTNECSRNDTKLSDHPSRLDMILNMTLNHLISLVSGGCRIHQLHLYKEVKSHPNECPGYDTIWWWGSCLGALRNVESPLYHHYSQVHSESEW